MKYSYTFSLVHMCMNSNACRTFTKHANARSTLFRVASQAVDRLCTSATQTSIQHNIHADSSSNVLIDQINRLTRRIVPPRTEQLCREATRSFFRIGRSAGAALCRGQTFFDRWPRPLWRSEDFFVWRERIFFFFRLLRLELNNMIRLLIVTAQ